MASVMSQLTEEPKIYLYIYFFFNLVFMDPCIVVRIGRNKQQDATLY
jgi:hypothetical protein